MEINFFNDLKSVIELYNEQKNMRALKKTFLFHYIYTYSLKSFTGLYNEQKDNRAFT